MSMPLAIENPRADARKSFGRAPSDMVRRLRTAVLRVALMGLVATPACQLVPGDAGSAPATAASGATAKDASHVGEFSGRYQDGLPVYLFPTIYVIGKRTAD